MTILTFGPIDNTYSIYRGELGAAWFVRIGNHLVGIGRDRDHAQAIARAHQHKSERGRREDPVFFMAA